MKLLLMVHTSQTTTWDVEKPCKSWDKLPTSTGEFTGFLNHQPVDIFLFQDGIS